MREKNTKKKGRFLTAGTISLMIFIFISSLAYLWQHMLIIQLGNEIRKDEMKLSQLFDESARLQSLVSRIESPSNIEEKLAHSNLDLKISNQIEVIHVRL
jgi:hypothetical protein